MIISLPKSVTRKAVEVLVPLDEPLCKLSRITGGVLAYNCNGKIVGQIFKDTKKSVRVSVADGGTLIVTRTDNGVDIKDVTFDEKENRGINKVIKKRSFNAEEFITYGDVYKSQYQLFLRKKGEVKPILAFNVVQHPLDDDVINVKVNDGMNVLWVILLTSAIEILR